MTTATTALPIAVDQQYEIAHLKLVPKRHVGRMIAATVVLALLAALVRAFSLVALDATGLAS